MKLFRCLTAQKIPKPTHPPPKFSVYIYFFYVICYMALYLLFDFFSSFFNYYFNYNYALSNK